MSNEKLSNEETSLLSKWLKIVPTPNSNEETLRRQLMQDFNEFERWMRLQFIFANDKKEPHPFHVKSNWKPPITQSVALESYLDEVKPDLSEATFIKPKDNLIKGTHSLKRSKEKHEK